MAESESGCSSLGPAFDDSSSSTSASQAALSTQTTQGSIQMDLSGFLTAKGSQFIPEIQVKDAFRHLPARLSAIDSLDQSIVDNEEDQPLFCDGVGDEEVLELDT